MSDVAPTGTSERGRADGERGIVVVGDDAVLAPRVAASLAAPLVSPGAPLPEGSRCLVWLGPAAGPAPLDDCTGTGVLADPAGFRVASTAPSSTGLERIVVLSTAMVYGAWPNNPVPLTEDAVLRPEPGFEPVVRAAELERIAAEHAREHPDRTVIVLRPAVTVSGERSRWLAASPWSARGLYDSDAEPPAQYLHVDDLVAAIALVAVEGPSGVCNVAPDGWLRAEEVRALAGPRPRVLLPEDVAARLDVLRWRFGRTGVPEGLAAYTRSSWVVANDRLRARGWVPAHANDEAFVASSEPGPFGRLDARRRQHLALGGVAAGVAAAAGAVLLAWRRGVSARRGG